MTNITKAEHTIQCALLREFAAINNKKKPRESKIYQFSLKTKLNGLKFVRKVETYQNIYPQHLEDDLNNKIETRGIRLIRRIIKFKQINFLKDEEINLFKNYILVQFYRTPFFKNLLTSFLRNKISPETTPDEYEILVEEIFNTKILCNLQNPELLEFHVGLISNSTSIPFILSDSPVTLFDYNKDLKKYAEINSNSIPTEKGEKRVLDIRIIFSEGTVLAMPIHPYLLFVVYQNFHFDPIVGRDTNFIKSINTDIYRQSDHYIYSKFKIEEKMFINDQIPDSVNISHEFSNTRENYTINLSSTRIKEFSKKSDYFLSKYDHFLHQLNKKENYDISRMIQKHQYSNMHITNPSSFVGFDLVEKLKVFYSENLPEEEVIPIFLELVFRKKIT